MRLATYNIEWMSGLFGADDQLMEDDAWSSRHNVTRAQQIAALGHVFQAMDADGVMIIEAPDASPKRSTEKALGAFAKRFDLRTRAVAHGFSNDTQQEIAFLYDPDVLTAHHDPQGPESGAGGRDDAPRFDGVFRLDLDVDATEDLVRFSKPPLELHVETVNGQSVRMIGAHLKSKAPHGAKTRDEVMQQSIANRRKQLAQAIWLRSRIAQLFEADESIILMGDLNDGPGLDQYEYLFGRSSVEIILGNKDEPKLFDPHAARALGQRIGAVPTTSRFWISKEKRYLQALLDYIMISEDLLEKGPHWRIWHPLDDPECWKNTTLREALVAASDHFPVSLDIAL